MNCKPSQINALLATAVEHRPIQPLFDAFLASGEFTVLCGAETSGKSLLGVHIAESIARGRQIWTFEMPETSRKVLYLDLVMSRAQFKRRYVSPPRYQRPRERGYKFSKNFDAAWPGDDLADLDKWLVEQIEVNGYELIVIDDLSALRRGLETPRAVARLVRQLKRICSDTGAAILLLATTDKNLERSPVRRQMLFDPADSIVEIGTRTGKHNEYFIKQKRVRNRPLVWNADNAPIARIERSDDGFLGFVFDHRTGPQIDTLTRSLICRLHSMSEQGRSMRQISLETGINLSRISRLIRKWTPFMQMDEDDAEAERLQRSAIPAVEENKHDVISADTPEFDDEDGDDLDEADDDKPWLEIERLKKTDRSKPDQEESDIRISSDSAIAPVAAALTTRGRRTIYDLEHRLDAYGKDIWVEKVCEHTNRPNLWYQFNSKGLLTRWERGLWGSTGNTLGDTKFIDAAESEET